MEYKVIFRSEKIISKDFSKIPKDILNIIFGKLQELGEKGLQNIQIKKLNHYDLCDYRMRVGEYRILFNMNEIEKEIIIFRVLHRSKLY